MPGTITVGGSTFNFISLRGEPEPVGLEVQEVSRPGQNGHAYWEVGKRGRPFEMEGYADYTSASAAATSFDAMKGKQGQVASSLLDDRGRTYFDVAVLSVEKVGIRPLAGSVGGLVPAGTGFALLIVRFRLQSTK
jgi:hypothetical protein